MVHAGETCETSQATASVASGTSSPAMMAVRSLSRTWRWRIAAMPEPPASTSATVGVPPPSRPFEIWIGAPKFGELSQGAPVCWIWWSSVGTHGRYSSPTTPKPISASRTRPRRSSDTYQHGTSATIEPAAMNSPQLCV